MSELAINGGTPVISSAPKSYTWIDKGVLPQIEALILSNSYSGFLAQPTAEHYGGNRIQKLEELWSEEFSVEHSITFNSWTSGLMAGVAALGIPKGEEVIVTPWTMSASVACIVANGLVPVFADIEKDSFNIDPNSVASKITSNTAAILGVDIFGKPCDAIALREIANRHGLKLIIDAAQTPRARLATKRSSHWADIAGYSLNRHKHLQVGEGGIAVTNDELYAKRMRLMRNHAEVTSGDEPDHIISVGHNWRMGELEAELAIYQLQRFETHLKSRIEAGSKLLLLLQGIPGLEMFPTPGEYEHDFYILGIKLTENLIPQRSHILEAIRAEGVTNIFAGYQALHRLKAFEKFDQNDLHTVNELHDRAFLGIYMCGNEFSSRDIQLIAEAIQKVVNSAVAITQ
jgi:dTDP-4-amino-4,6-dideoxygalactose transaminase